MSSYKIIFNSMVIIVLNIFLCPLPITGQNRLQSLNVVQDSITLSGFSSGGTFAQQLQISFSSLFSGIGVFSHTYYRCGPGDGVEVNYDNVCTKIGNFTNDMLWDPNSAVNDINTYFRQGLIENPNNLRNKRLYVYAGTQNAFFSTDQSLRILNVYETFIRNPELIKTRVQNASLTLPSNNFGGPCWEDSSNNTFISNCGLSGAFEALNFLYGDTRVSRAPNLNKERVNLQPLQIFNQTEFTTGLNVANGGADMDETGFLYVPAQCRQRKCLLHVYFHGCLVGREFNNDSHIRNSGFLEVAELNNIVMLFPQARSRSPQNEIGCWDTYGITGRLYATQQGAQVRAVRDMLSRILESNESQFPIRDEPQNENEGKFSEVPSIDPSTQVDGSKNKDENFSIMRPVYGPPSHPYYPPLSDISFASTSYINSFFDW